MNPSHDHIVIDLPAHVNGTLEPAETARVQTHLTGCPACRAELDDWQAIAAAAQDWKERFVISPPALAIHPRNEATHDQTINHSPAFSPLPLNLPRRQGWRMTSAAIVVSAIAALLVVIIYRFGGGYHETDLRDERSTPTRAALSVPAASPTSAAFSPTHRSNPDLRVNLRPSPSVDNDPIAILDAGALLESLDEQHIDREGRFWLRFRTENGDIGWLRDGTFEELPVNTWPDASPAATLSLHKQSIPTGCTIPPRPAGRQEIDLLARQDADAPPVLAGRPTRDEATALLDALPAADDQTITGIAATAALLVACQADAYTYADGFFDGPTGFDFDSPFFALFSDNAYRRGDPPWSILLLPSGARPLTVERAGMLPDGRALALLHDAAWSVAGYDLVVFVRSGEYWLVEENAQVTAGSSDDPIPDYTPPQILKAVILDGGVYLRLIPSQSAFRASRAVQLVVTNLDNQDRRLRIDDLSIDVSLTAGGQTVLVIPPSPAGNYRITTDQGFVSGIPTPALPDYLLLVEDDGPIPVG